MMKFEQRKATKMEGTIFQDFGSERASKRVPGRPRPSGGQFMMKFEYRRAPKTEGAIFQILCPSETPKASLVVRALGRPIYNKT